LKRKRLDRDIWCDITKKRYVQKDGILGEFNGIASILYIDETSKTTMFRYDHLTFKACNSGMIWLELIPRDEYYMVTAFIDTDGTINAWYIDMIGGWGMCADGVAYFDDLYLDIGVHPSGYIMVDDMDELEDALRDGVITKELFDIAISEKDKLINGILKDIGKLESDCLRLVELMEIS
jgi:predicted RNA-binding protein associated with RNAse of E/G family